MHNWYYYLQSEEKLSDTTIFLAFALLNKVIVAVDWSGEEYPGQVKRGITQILKQQNFNPITWKNKNIEREIFASNPNRGEYLPLLFQKLDSELINEKLSIGFFECGDDQFYFFVLPEKAFLKIQNIKGNDFAIIDTNIYEVYIIDIGVNTTKVMIYLKNRFNIPLGEIKQFLQQDRILVAKGNMLIIDSTNKEIEKLGAKTEIIKQNN